MVVLSDLHNSEFGAYNSELVDKVGGAGLLWPRWAMCCDLAPYPEELNRQAVGVLARYNFAPPLLSTAPCRAVSRT